MANTYLKWTPSSAGERKKWTMSVWLKRSKIGTQSMIYNQYKDGNYYNSYLTIQSDDQLNFVNYAESTTANIKTTRKFRDTSAWYHIVLAVDTTQGTASNRIKIYINGVQETSFATATYPSQNLEMFANQTQPQQWGVQRFASSSQGFFDGLMSYVAFVDGTAELPTIFGETDSTTGQWKIKTGITPSVAWGNNGYLILKDGNSLSDQSSNSNNFSLGGGAITKTEDCPDNVFNVFSDTTSKKAYTSEAGLKVSETASSWNLGVGGTIGASSGKYYWEFYKTANSDNFIAGIIPSNEFHRLAESTAVAVYNNTNAIQIGASTSWWYKIGTGSSTAISGYGHGSGSKSSGLFQFALDLTNKKMWIGKDGTWYNSGNPATGTNPLWTGSAVFPDDIYVPYWQGYGTVSGRFNFGGGSFGSDAVASAGTNASGNGVFELDVPTGFTAISTKGINL